MLRAEGIRAGDGLGDVLDGVEAGPDLLDRPELLERFSGVRGSRAAELSGVLDN
jgi:hypothetical protein